MSFHLKNDFKVIKVKKKKVEMFLDNLIFVRKLTVGQVRLPCLFVSFFFNYL